METSYNTKQGSLILSFLQEQPGKHFTADDIIAELAKTGNSVGKATVYRHLDKLVKQGTVRKYIAEEGQSACFEYIDKDGDCTSHYHLKCSECGRLIHVECGYLDEVAGHILEHHGFVISPEKTVLYGVCDKCREALDEK
ncbi:MAG TPA: transcriptional repressor [Ruminococcaceae bacterium]|mgnify:FL=1|nr:transcriptional repressor [Oscillospiraceae bacterium]